MPRIPALSALTLAAALAAGPVASLDFAVEERRHMISDEVQEIRITVTGEFVPGDAETLSRLLADLAARRTAAGLPPIRPVLFFDSPGGWAGGGPQVGLVIRDAGLETYILEGATCASACSVAFLGGVRRVVLGSYEIHAIGNIEAGIADAEDLRQAFDWTQLASQELSLYARAMIGDDRVVHAMFLVGSTDLAYVEDDLLAEFSIITDAARVTQMPAVQSGLLAGCRDNSSFNPVTLKMCSDLALGRAVQHVEALLAGLQDRPEAAELNEQQVRFEHALFRCNTTAPDPGEMRRRVGQCLTDIVELRRRQLAAVADTYAVQESEMAQAGWLKPGMRLQP